MKGIFIENADEALKRLKRVEAIILGEDEEVPITESFKYLKLRYLVSRIIEENYSLITGELIDWSISKELLKEISTALAQRDEWRKPGERIWGVYGE